MCNGGPQFKGQHTFSLSFSNCFCSFLFLLLECLIFSRTPTSCRSSWVNFSFWVSIYLLILFCFLVDEKQFYWVHSSQSWGEKISYDRCQMNYKNLKTIQLYTCIYINRKGFISITKQVLQSKTQPVFSSCTIQIKSCFVTFKNYLLEPNLWNYLIFFAEQLQCFILFYFIFLQQSNFKTCNWQLLLLLSQAWTGTQVTDNQKNIEWG